MVGPDRPQFVLFGSTMDQLGYSFGGWGGILADLYTRKADVLLRGYSGWNTRMALTALDRIFPKVCMNWDWIDRKLGQKDKAVQPLLVIVYFCGNDATNPHPSGLGAHVPLSEYVENMKKIILHLKSLSDKTRIICLGSPPVNEAQVREVYRNTDHDDQTRTNEGCRKYSKALLDLCQTMDVEGIDLWTAIQRRDDWGNACLADGIHLSEGGSKVVLEEILKVLKKVKWEPSLYWLSMPPEFPEDSPFYVVGSDGKTTVNVSTFIADWKIPWMDI